MNILKLQKLLGTNPLLTQLMVFVSILILSFLLYQVLKRYVLKMIENFSKKTKSNFDNILVEKKFFRKIIYIIPILIYYVFSSYFPAFEILIKKLTLSLMVWIVLISFSAFMEAVNAVYSTRKRNKNKPIKGYIQIVVICFYIVGFIFIFSIITDSSPLVFISGLGAMTAIILLIFKDTILSLIASMQISFNDLVKIGDWLSIPQYNADGEVIDVALHTIKVQNWDKTISVIPTHKLVEGSFKNWRGMMQAGGRRIKKLVHIDINSIKFCDEEMLRKFRKFDLLKAHLEKHKNAQLTNVGVFRKYLNEYLLQHPQIRNDMTFLVRQLTAGPTGLPLEIYVFANDIVWANYENIQADIFDHILAILPQFDLKIFQYPTGISLKTK